MSLTGTITSARQSSTAQTIAATRQYDAFGNVVSSSETWAGPFGYAGGFGYQEEATGLKLLGHRYYDSSTGRFLTRDPIKDGRNWYAYCSGDPVAFMDDGGLRAVGIQFGVGGIAILVTGSASMSLLIDIDTGHIGTQEQAGFGVGAGLSFGAGLGCFYDNLTTVNGNGEDEIGTVNYSNALGIAIIFVQMALALDDSGNVTGGGGSLGLGNNHGEGAGVFYEKRIAWTSDLSQWFLDFLDKEVIPKMPSYPQELMMELN